MVDVNAQIDAVERRVGSTEVDGAPARRQTLTQVYASPLEDVWDAVTSADRIPRWFMPIEGDLRLGGTYQLVGNAGGRIEECRPPSEAAAGYRATWEYGGGVSWIEVDLRAVDASHTELTLAHIARESDVPEEFWDLYGPGATGIGWDLGILGLALHLASDASIPPEQGEQWTVSEEGRRFVRRSADGWAAAFVADGGDPEQGARAADAAYAFFSGDTGSSPDA